MPDVKTRDVLSWGGERYGAGEVLTVDDATAARWARHGIADPVEAEEKPAKRGRKPADADE